MGAPHHKMTRQMMLDSIEPTVVSALIRDRIMATGAYAGMPHPLPPRRRVDRERRARERRLAEIDGHAAGLAAV